MIRIKTLGTFLIIAITILMSCQTIFLSNNPLSCKDEFVISDSLFNLASLGGFTFYSKDNNTDENIADNIFTYDEPNINFGVSYACGRGITEIKLVSDGNLHTDILGKKYFDIKLYFRQSSEVCMMLYREILCFNMSTLKPFTTEKFYLKFVGVEGVINYR